MKAFILISAALLLVFASCNFAKKTVSEKPSFGIYGTVRLHEISAKVLQNYNDTNLIPEKDTLGCIIGYLQQNLIPKNCNPLKLLKTANTIDEEGKYCAVAVVENLPVITNADIKKTKSNGNNVLIHFTMPGAKKWAEFVKQNKGRSIAFVIDNEVYSLPLVNANIDNGSALINGLKDETEAKILSDMLNKSR